MKFYTASFLAGCVLLLAGCTFPSSQPTVARSQVGIVQSLDLGYVLEVRDVIIDGERTVIGVFGGGAIGAAAAHPTGSVGVGEALGQAAAATAGAVVGSAVEEKVTRKRAQELTIQLDNGSTIVVINEIEEAQFRQGDRVQVNSGGWGPATVRMAIN